MNGSLGAVVLELWIARQLGDLALFTGDTTPQIRADRLRQVLLARGLADKSAGRRNHRTETWAELFLRLYGQPLIDKQTSKQSELQPCLL